jgi:hypothetical protein
VVDRGLEDGARQRVLTGHLCGDDAHQALERRALAGAVAAEPRDHLVRLDAQRDVEQDVRIPVIGIESGDLEQAHAARTPPR